MPFFEQTFCSWRPLHYRERTSSRSVLPLLSDPSHALTLCTEQPFILLARSILLAIESGQLDPDKAGSGVSYGERALRRVSSWGSGLKTTNRGGKCC